MNTDKPFLGVLLMLCFCIVAPLGDSIAKLLGGVVPLVLLLTVRFGIQALVLLPICWLGQISLKLPKGLARLIWARTILHILGIGTMFTALRYLPIADAFAISFVMPFIMLLLGHFAMGETVGVHRFSACAVGFIGTLLVIQPNFVEVGALALIPLSTAVIFALFMMVTRKVAKSLNPIALQTIGGAQACLILLPVLYFFPAATEIGHFEQSTYLLLLCLGLLGTVAHLLMTWSLRFAPASTLAPMQYLEIPVATMFGLVIFDELPNGLAAIGILVTVGAGLYIIGRERRLSADQDVTSEV